MADLRSRALARAWQVILRWTLDGVEHPFYNPAQEERSRDMNQRYDLDVICGMYKMDTEPANWTASVVAYHVTRKANAEIICNRGIEAKKCQAVWAGSPRQAAVYLFASRNDAFDPQMRAFLFGGENDLVVVKVSIPKSHYHLMRDDGLFNASAICSDGSYPYGIQYLDDIPADWIKEIV